MRLLARPFSNGCVRALGVTLFACLLIPTALAAGVTVRFMGDPVDKEVGRWTRAVAEAWAKSTGNTLEYISRPNDGSATLLEYQQYWAAKSSQVDVYMLNAIWQGVAAPHAVDLKKYIKDGEVKQHFPRIVENNTLAGKFVSLPMFAEAGLLYYRTDLLQKYGYQGPPKTWEELADMAKKIQEGERAAGLIDFYGFVFEGKASESLTCNAIEWVYSYGGGTIIERDKRVSIDNPNAIKALDAARSWIGVISPAGVTTYGEEEARIVWQAGNAAFMRNWPYAYALGEDPKSLVSGKFGITVLPKGGKAGMNAACLAGWDLMVSVYSAVPDAAVDLVRYLTSREIQKKGAIDLGELPTRLALYNDPDVLAQNSWFKNIPDVLANAVARPSTVTGVDYNLISTGFYQNVSKALAGGEDSKDAVSGIERIAKRMVH
jgi:trehalose/maltose transport system substrate-binding protein